MSESINSFIQDTIEELISSCRHSKEVVIRGTLSEAQREIDRERVPIRPIGLELDVPLNGPNTGLERGKGGVCGGGVGLRDALVEIDRERRDKADSLGEENRKRNPQGW